MPGAHHLPLSRLVLQLSGELLAISARIVSRLWTARLGLNAVRVEVVLGFVFICLAGEPPPARADLCGRRSRRARAAPLRADGTDRQPLSIEHWDVDWKIAMDNYLESYHVPIGHPGLNRMFTPDYEDQTDCRRHRARHQLDARASLLALERAHVPGTDR